MNKKTIVKILDRLAESNRDPKIELEYRDDLTLLIAIMLSAQATDKQVNKVTQILFTKFQNINELLGLGFEQLRELINSINYYNVKAKNIIKTCHIIVDKYDGKIPSEYSDLITLPGVGRKTAHVFLNVFHKQDVMAVDTHVARVSNRLGISQSDNVVQIEQDLVDIIPKKSLRAAHHLLVLHGRYICKARKPLCGECVLRDLCPYAK